MDRFIYEEEGSNGGDSASEMTYMQVHLDPALLVNDGGLPASLLIILGLR